MGNCLSCQRCCPGRSSGLDVAGRAEGSAWQDVFMLLRQRNSLVTPQGAAAAAAAAAAGVSPQANTMAASTPGCERWVARPSLTKSRTLPSIPQSPPSPRASRVSGCNGTAEKRRRRLPSTPASARLCPTTPPGDEDEDDDGFQFPLSPKVERLALARSHQPLPQICLPDDCPFERSQQQQQQQQLRRSRTLGPGHFRKSHSVDESLGQAQDSTGHLPSRGHTSRADGCRAGLKRKASLGSVDRRDSQLKRFEGGLARLTQRLNHKERRQSQGNVLSDRLALPEVNRQRSVSFDWSCTGKMAQPLRDVPLPNASRRTAAGGMGAPGNPSSPSAAKRLYRNLSGKFRSSSSSFEEACGSSGGGGSGGGRADRDRQRKPSTGLTCVEAMFEAVEHQDMDTVQGLLSRHSAEELDLSSPNSDGLTPLDVAVMTNNVPIARMLLTAGAHESPEFASTGKRLAHLAGLVEDAERRADELMAALASEPASAEATEWQKQLRAWEWRQRLFRRMVSGIQHASVPEAPAQVCLSVTGADSLAVTFQEPHSVNSAVVTRYRVEWSLMEEFEQLAGEAVLEDCHSLCYQITGLTSGCEYYVRVMAYNMKGWGPTQTSLPVFAIPSDWRQCDGREVRDTGHRTEALEHLLKLVKNARQQWDFGENSKIQGPSRKHSVSKSLKYLFQSTSKFVKSLKRGLYLATVFYQGETVLVTHEDQIPVVEIDDSYPSPLNQDFLWFTKLSCMWEEVRGLRHGANTLYSASSALQSRQRILLAISQMQHLIGTQDLGQPYHELVKDKHGNALLVTLREVEVPQGLPGGRWQHVSRLQSQRKSLSTPEEPSALDILLITLQDKLSYHRASRQTLPPGLYLGYLKLCSSVDQIKVLVPQRIPNSLVHLKVRDNPHVSREEWEGLSRISGPVDTASGPGLGGPGSSQDVFLKQLSCALSALLKQLHISPHQAKEFRIYNQEVLEFGDRVSFMLLLPPSDDVCVAPGQSNAYPTLSGLIALPLQIFEIVHLLTFEWAFISRYCCLSALLDLELLLAQQALREAFSDGELAVAKQRHQAVLDFVQQVDEVWKESRWIMNVLQHARYKQPPSGVPIRWLISTSEEVLIPKPNSTSSNMEYLPSPSPSPDLLRRTTYNDLQGTSDEDGLSEVFLPTDSDYESSCAQSPKELDLLYTAPAAHASTPDRGGAARRGDDLDDAAPDVLQAHDVRRADAAAAAAEGGSRARDLEALFGCMNLDGPEAAADADAVRGRRCPRQRGAAGDGPQAAFEGPCYLEQEAEWRSVVFAQSRAEDAELIAAFHAARENKRAMRADCVDAPEDERAEGGRTSVPFASAGEARGGDTEWLGEGEACHAETAEGMEYFPRSEAAVLQRVSFRLPSEFTVEDSVEIPVTSTCTAKDIVRRALQKLEELASREAQEPLPPGFLEEHVEHFSLVATTGAEEVWLQEHCCPLSLAHPWDSATLCVSIKPDSPLSYLEEITTKV
ncbi:ankyrin repeat and fibronectin type-III domain-containing protein 1-like isoform X3 [Petromyzon marinus]|uniref:ankyrin repeat and fibronectin type-III domain-containing protein 1-like isoform X3 n=1 Tax=Petromyzon marinus TaxID=7757 RepID=UPI003F6E6657